MTACQACGRRALIGRIDYGSEILCGQHFVKRHQGEDWILGVTVQKKEMFFLAVGKSDCEKAALILRGLQ